MARSRAKAIRKARAIAVERATVQQREKVSERRKRTRQSVVLRNIKGNSPLAKPTAVR